MFHVEHGIPPLPPQTGYSEGMGTSDPAVTASPRTTRVIAVALQKGGVGKTTTTINLGACLAEQGYRVLILDMDPQGNASSGLNFNIRTTEKNIYDVLIDDVPLEDVVESTEVRNLFMVTANQRLAGAEVELVPMLGRETRLKAAVAPIKEQFDYILIDCQPSLGLLTVNALVAADEVFVPLKTDYFSLEGMIQLEESVSAIAKFANPTLEITRIILTMHDPRTNLANQVVQEVRQKWGARVCQAMIPDSVRLAEAPSYGKPITTFDPSSAGAKAYRAVALEVSGGEAKRSG